MERERRPSPPEVEALRLRWLDYQASYDAAFEIGLSNADRVRIALDVEEAWSTWRQSYRACYGHDPDDVSRRGQQQEA